MADLTAENDDLRACFGCGHVHAPGSPGRCWEAACHPSCPEDHGDGGPYQYEPGRGVSGPPASTPEEGR